MSFFKKQPKSIADMSDTQLKEALSEAYIKANQRAQKQEIVYGNYSQSTAVINEIVAARIALQNGNRRLAIDFLR